MKGGIITPIAVLALLTAGCLGFTGPPDPTLSVPSASASAGSTVTVQVTAQHIAYLGVSRPPSLIEGYSPNPKPTLDLASATVEPMTETTSYNSEDQYWKWDEAKENVTVQMPIVIPEDATPGRYRYRLNVFYGEQGRSSGVVGNGTVRVTDVPQSGGNASTN